MKNPQQDIRTHACTHVMHTHTPHTHTHAHTHTHTHTLHVQSMVITSKIIEHTEHDIHKSN